MISELAGWTFYDYIAESRRNPFSEWMKGVPEDAAAFIDDRLLKMEGLLNWSEKWASNYRGRDKIIELRITFNKVQYRPLGMHSPYRRHGFVLLAGAIEKGGKIPSTDLDTAEKRRDRLLRERDCVVPHLYEG